MGQKEWIVDRLDEIDSTNVELARRAREGAASRSVIVADVQSQGRGRLDREWHAPAGSSLLCSVLVDAPEGVAPQWAVVAAALALAEALETLTGVRPDLKWPNDVLFGDEKVAGLLAELVDAPRSRLVVGLGVNLSDVDPAYTSATTVRRATGVDLGVDELLDANLEVLARQLDALGSPGGAERVGEEYRGSLVTLLQRVRVELASGPLYGVAVGVDDEGALLVDVGNETMRFHAADVVHVRKEDRQ